MPAEVKIRVSRGTDKKVRAEIKRLARKIGDTTTVNRQVSVWLLRWVAENFRTEGGNVGGWDPFKYGGRRLKGGFIDTSAKLLQDTGELRASFKNFWSRRFAGVGSALDRSVWHDQGVPENNLPARRLLPSEEDQEVNKTILKIYDAHVQRAIR